MASTIDDYIALINRLLAEKDQLVAEKDRLVVEKEELGVSKDRLWRELYQLLRERDSEIERLKYHGEDTPASSGNVADPQYVHAETRQLKRRIRELGRALRDALDQDAEVEEYAYLDGEEAPTDVQIEHDKAVKREVSTSPAAIYGTPPPSVEIKKWSSSPAASSALPTAESNESHPPSVVFTFAPLISVAADGAYNLGNINDVAASVIQSIEMQVQISRDRYLEGICPPFPSPQFRSGGCMWSWVHKSADTTRWTQSEPGQYTCATCFNARRACLTWLGNKKWMVLPLPPSVKSGGVVWSDAGYYIHQGPRADSATHFPGIWTPSKWKKAKLR
ncbi:hypothetical protein LTS10_001804 [Elasticomyces elasticus]|nr:hypothetical protein LTS10_001804 [Elasticomyces elasticus]